MHSKLESLSLYNQSQIDIGKVFSTIRINFSSYEQNGLKFNPGDFSSEPTKIQIDLSNLRSFKIIKYSSNMLNEYSLYQILSKAVKLKELNLSEISAFKDK